MGRILGWENPLRKLVPGGEFLVKNVDLWVGKDSGKDLGRILGWKIPLRKVFPGGEFLIKMWICGPPPMGSWVAL